MKKIIIWGTGVDYNKNINLIKFYEMKNEFCVVGVTSNDSHYEYLDGYRFFAKNEIENLDYDYILLCASKKQNEIFSEIRKLSISKDKIILISSLYIPNLHFDEYVKLKEKNVSIIANNCWGGLTYHYLGLEFKSPFINMYEKEDEYLNLLKNLKESLQTPIKLVGTNINEELNIEYPIYNLNGCKLYMNHYPDFDEAKRKWEERINKINWNNLFVMFMTESVSNAEIFDSLPYKNKICFVPFQTDLKSCYTITINDFYEKKKPFYTIVNGCAYGLYRCYDVIDLLNGCVNYADRYKIKKLCKV